MKLPFCSAAAFFLPTVLLLFATSARCDEPDDNPPPLVNELSQQEALQVKVTLEATHQPIKEFLAELSQQGHITLSVPDASPAAGKLVTAHLENYALAEAMQSLEQLYGVRWNQVSEHEWSLNQPVGNDFDRYLGQLGDFKWFNWRIRNLQAHTAEAQTDFATELAGIDWNQLRMKEGVNVSQLPNDLQSIVRRRAEQRSSVNLVEQLFRTRVPLIDSYVLKIGPSYAADPIQEAGIYLSVQTPTESWALPVIPSPAPLPAQPAQGKIQ